MGNSTDKIDGITLGYCCECKGPELMIEPVTGLCAACWEVHDIPSKESESSSNPID